MKKFTIPMLFALLCIIVTSSAQETTTETFISQWDISDQQRGNCNLTTTASADIPLAINDNSCPVTQLANIQIAETGVISDDAYIDNLTIDITHTWDADISITLISPQGTELLLSENNGANGDNYTNTVFTDFGDDITAADAPFTGAFQPQGGTFAAAFAGEQISGNWAVAVCDDAGGDTGTINSLSITTCVTPPVPVCSSYASTDVPLAINDNSCPVTQSALVQIAETGVISDDAYIDNLTIDITHTWDADISITLISPQGTELLLSENNGANGDNYTNTVFTDFGDDITAADAPFTGAFQPQGGTFAAAFAGEQISGNWAVAVCDDAGGDTGTINSLSITTCVIPGADPTPAPAPDPTEDAANVISMFSGVYTDVPVDTWLTPWSQAQLEEIEIEGNDTKLYTNLDFAGIETIGNPIDATNMDFIHMDVWSPNATTFRIKLVDLGAGVVEGEIAFSIEQEQWVSLQIPLEDFANPDLVTNSANLLTVRNSIQQLIISGLPVGAVTAYIDNVYFSQLPTPDCNPVTGITISDITETSAVVSWEDEATAFDGYVVGVFLSGSDPTVDEPVYEGALLPAGTLTDTATGLSSDTMYEAFVLSLCDEDGNIFVISDGVQFTTEEELGLADSTIEGFTFYPNPSSDVINLTATENIEKIAIYNLLGQKVIDQNINATSSQLNVANLVTGTYLMEVSAGAKTAWHKVIKK